MARRKNQSSYCPYDIVDNPQAFGLIPYENCKTAFGRTYVAVSPQRSETVSIFLHGVGSSWAAWTPLLQQAALEGVGLGDVLFLDLPGFGKSKNELGHLEAEVVGAEILKLSRTFGWSDVKLVGHSMGGFLALDIASRNHAEVSAISIISGAYFSVIDTVNRVNSLGSAFSSVRDGIPAARPYVAMSSLALLGPFAKPLLWTLYEVGVLPHLLAATVRYPDLMRSSTLAAIAENLRPKAFKLAARNGEGYDPIFQWAQIKQPIRALFGSSDNLVPPTDGERLAGVLPGATIEVADDVGHYCHVERPALALKFLLD